MPKTKFSSLRVLAKERRTKDLSKFDVRQRLMHGEVGQQLFLVEINNAALTRNVHGPNGLIELRGKVKELYRSYLGKKRVEKHEVMRYGYSFLLKRYRDLMGRIDKMIQKIEPKK